MSLGLVAKVLWGGSPSVHRAPRNKSPPFPNVICYPHGKKKVTLSRSSSLEVARCPELRRHPLLDQKTNPRRPPPYYLGRRQLTQRPAVPSSDDLRISQATIYSFLNRKLHSGDSRIHQASRCSHSLRPVMMVKRTMKVRVGVMIEHRALISPEIGVWVRIREGKGADCHHWVISRYDTRVSHVA